MIISDCVQHREQPYHFKTFVIRDVCVTTATRVVVLILLRVLTCVVISV